MADYPVIDPKTLAPLRIIQAELAQNPEFLDSPECPYSPSLKAFLAGFGAQILPKTSQKPTFLGSQGDKWAILEQEANALYEELRDFSEKISDSDVAERMSYFRTATSLLEKIVSINERAAGLKHVNDFHQTVLSIFDEELTPDQRTKIMARLRASIDATEETPHD